MTRSERFFNTRYVVLAMAAVLIAALVVPFAVQHAAAQTVTYTAVVTTPKLNVRKGPGAGYPVVTTADQFTKVTVLGRTSNSSWAKIKLPTSTEGWASTAYMEPNVPWSSIPVINPASPNEPTGFITTGALNLRTGPSTSYPVAMTASQGTAVGLVGRNANGTWLQVRLNNKLGWGNAAFIATTVEIMSLPDTSGSVPPPATSTPTMTPNPSGTPSATAVPTATTAPATNTASVKSGRLNVRSGPGSGFAVLATLKYGDVVTLIGRNANASWVKVRTANNVEGWVSSLYISVTNETLYALPVMGDVIPSGVIVAGTANLRGGPGIEYNVITTLNYGTIVNLVARTNTVSWIKITVNGQTGWVGSDLVATDYNLGYLPVATK